MTSSAKYIVVDTNVLISAGLLPRSRTAVFLEVVLEEYVLARNEATWRELETRIAKTKFDRYFGEIGRVQHLRKISQVSKDFPQNASVDASVDKTDNKFVGLALDAGCRLIISGDSDLTDLKSYGDIEILTPAQFLARCNR